MKALNSMLFLLITITFFSCSKDDEVVPDQRDMLVGDYRYESVIVATDESERYESGTISISKHTTNAQQVILSIDGVEFIGAKLTGDAEGVLFDLQPINLVDQEGDGYRVLGVPRYQYENVQYHVFYEHQEEKLSLTITTDYINDEYDQYNTLAVIKGRKN